MSSDDIHSVPTLDEVTTALRKRYPPSLAESWDYNGVVAGHPSDPVQRVLFSVDLTREVVAEACAVRADLIVTHHPLLLRGVHSIAQTTAKGEMLHTLARAGERGVAVYAAHTTADSAENGVSEVLARALHLRERVPLLPSESDPRLGLGRVGVLEQPHRVWEVCERLQEILCDAPGGVRVAGDPDTRVSRIAVCGGAGDSLLAHVAEAGADVYITADLRHHVVQEHREQYNTVLIDAGHWATEQLWCAPAAQTLQRDLSHRVTCSVSDIVTDPWSFTLGARGVA